MLEITNQTEKEAPQIVAMKDMNPLQGGRIVALQGSEFNGSYVCRTASTDKFEVMNLSRPGANRCWTALSARDIKVRLLLPGEEITLKLFNK